LISLYFLLIAASRGNRRDTDIPRNIKKALYVAEMIYALLTGRAMSLLLKAFLVYVLYLVIHRYRHCSVG
jgi:hypothetical protein